MVVPVVRKGYREGFTLIELLVVIAIIAILAAIIFPTFAKVRGKALQISCLSNVKQLGMAIEQYTEDNDERLPGQVSAGGGNGLTGGWIYYKTFESGFDVSKGSIYTYLDHKGVYLCPADNLGDRNGLSYSMNACLAGPEPPGGGFEAGKAVAQIENPSGMLLLGEEAAFTNFNKLNLELYQSSDDGHFQTDYVVFSTRHNGGSNVLFADNHAKWYRRDKAESDKILTGGQPACP